MFNKLYYSDNQYIVTSKLAFPTTPIIFHESTIDKVFEFAYAMTFGAEGEHRHYRSGGQTVRHQGEIFANTFQGKLAECAVCNLLFRCDSRVFPDFSVAKLGIWDNVDVTAKGKMISVKSTKSYGNLLLLESADWDEDGRYKPNLEGLHNVYDYFILVRISPYCEDIMKSHRWLYQDSISRNELYDAVKGYSWGYDIPGYITLNDLKQIIKQGNIIHQGSWLNQSTVMDADNYYVQAGDMRNPKDLCNELLKCEE